MKNILALLTMVIGAGCGIDDSGSDEDDSFEMRELVSVPLAHGGTLELLEAAPGIIVASETAPLGSRLIAADLGTDDPQVLFETLRPSAMSAPPELDAALARRERLLATGELSFGDMLEWKRPQTVADVPETGYSTVSQGLSSTSGSGPAGDRAWFIENFCVNLSGTFSFCDTDRWGSDTRRYEDVYRYACTGATFANTATMTFRYRVWFDWTTLKRWTIPAGYFRRVYTSQTGGLDYDGECRMATHTTCAWNDYACIVNTPKAGFHMAGEGRYHSTF